ncbi:YsnF/AvaK domain-containing protein [Gorillibacterium sp. sgz5001074]|uniref:YsnF/AvaK domain-containing protein n=1 Tax=Gorillibacterium sp. sgz5001074 TaxID=3446695 RepID=UPI003F66E9AF
MSFFGLFDDEKRDTEEVEYIDNAGVQVDVDKIKDTDADTDTFRSADRVEDGKVRLREEELDVSKYSVKTGEVILHKDVVEETRSVNVPVTHEQVVIERRTLNEFSDEPVGSDEVIRIPVSEERVDVNKRTVVTGEVEVHKHAIQETKEVNETVRKEVARLDVDGNPDIVNRSDVDVQ